MSEGKMTKTEHVLRHVELHKNFDELLADFLGHNRGKLPSNTTVFELMEWSAKQTSPITIEDIRQV